jgi:N-acetyl-S-(2-succino)cysteine monooxygenase
MAADLQMHFSFSAHLTGAHPAGWRHPSTQLDADTDIDAYRSMARLAEHGRFDMFLSPTRRRRGPPT